MYLALIADVIDSKIVQERFDLQKQLETTLQKINELFKDSLASAFTLTLGDEFQALLKVDAPIFQIIDTLRSELKPTQLRFGIGLGEIVTDQPIGMLVQLLIWFIRKMIMATPRSIF